MIPGFQSTIAGFQAAIPVILLANSTLALVVSNFINGIFFKLARIRKQIKVRQCICLIVLKLYWRERERESLALASKSRECLFSSSFFVCSCIYAHEWFLFCYSIMIMPSLGFLIALYGKIWYILCCISTWHSGRFAIKTTLLKDNSEHKIVLDQFS